MSSEFKKAKPKQNPLQPPRTIQSSELFQPGEKEILVDHHGVMYRIRITAQGRLIMVK